MVLASSAVRVDARQAAELASEALMIRADDLGKDVGSSFITWDTI